MLDKNLVDFMLLIDQKSQDYTEAMFNQGYAHIDKKITYSDMTKWILF